MTIGPDRKLNLSDPNRDAAGDELELLLQDAEEADAIDAAEDAGCDSFLDRFPRADPKKPG